MRRLAGWLVGFAAIGVSGCSREARDVGPTLPLTAPNGNADPRIALYQDNVAQVAQGGRYFAWYGCSGCHTETSQGAANLPDDRWHRGGGFAQVYATIALGHGPLAYNERVPTEQLWQLTAYVRDLPTHGPEKRRRAAVDQQAEPVGDNWNGPQ